MSTWCWEIVFSSSSSSVSEYLILLFLSLVKVSLVKDLFPDASGETDAGFRKHQSGMRASARPEAGKDCHLVVRGVLGTSVPSWLPEARAWESRLRAMFLQHSRVSL